MKTKVTMNLTQKDVDNTEQLTKQLNSRSKAATVSAALSLTATIMDAKKKGADIMVRNPDGTMERLVITGT